MIAEIILLGGALFWSLIVCSTVLFWWGVHNENHFPAIIIALILAILALFSPFNFYAWAFKNWGLLLLYVFGYVIAGIIWGFVYWWRTLILKKRELSMYENNWDNSIAKRQGQSFEQYLISYDYIPTFGKYKKTISVWIAYWPISVLDAFLTDFIINFFKEIVEFFKGIYIRIYENVFKDIINKH